MTQVAAGDLLNESFHRCCHSSILHCASMLQKTSKQMVEPVLRPNWCARHRFPKPLEKKNAGGMPAVLPLCKDHAGPLTEGRNTTAGVYAGAALHSCIVPRQCIQPFTQTTSRQYDRSADALRVPPLSHRHKRPVLPHKSCVTACVLPRTAD